MKKLFIAIILASLFVTVINNAVADTYRVEHAETTAQDDAVQKLIKKLEERDATIEELRAANLDLLVKNVGLEAANKELRAALKKKDASLKALTQRYTTVSKELNSAKTTMQQKLSEIEASVKRIEFKLFK